jgi:hypothetical protein
VNWFRRLLRKLRLARTVANDPTQIPTVVRVEREIDKAAKVMLVAGTLALSGCAILGAAVRTYPSLCASCVDLPTAAEQEACLKGYRCEPAPRPTPNTPQCDDLTGPRCDCYRVVGAAEVWSACPVVEPTPGPHPTPTPAPSSSPTPSPTATAPGYKPFITRVKRVSGFGDCSPRQPGKGRTASNKTCRGDRTYHYEMPSEQHVPKYAGMRCEQRPGGNRWYRVEGFRTHYGYTCSRFDETRDPRDAHPHCLCRDDQGSPCGGAPVCERGRFATCDRLRVGCNDLEWDAALPSAGSELTVHPTGGAVTCDNGNGFHFTCRGVPGATYELRARLYEGARTSDGRVILSTGDRAEFRKAGIW